MQTPWGMEAVFGDGEHEGHLARVWRILTGWAWCINCNTWEPAVPVQEVADGMDQLS